MNKSNSNFNITTGQQQSNSLLDKLFKSAGIAESAQGSTQNWDEIDGIYRSIAEGIVAIATEVNDTIKVINALGVLENKELEITVKGLTSDLESFTKDMVLIRSRHNDMSGPVKNGDELTICLGVFNDYVILNDRFRAVVYPTMLTVTEHLANAVEAKRRKDAENAATDVNVITDVEVKEVTK